MAVVIRLSALLWHRGGARQGTVGLLTIAGVLIATTLGLLALSVSPALGARGDRKAWRTPTAATGSGTAVQRLAADTFRGHTIDRVDLAPARRRTLPPPPPGLARFPRPGEIYVSPAMARLLRDVPEAALDDRYPGSVVGTIGSDGLAQRDDLVVVVGREEGAIPLGVAEGSPLRAGTPIDGWATAGSDRDLMVYQELAQIAAVLLIVPMLLLIGATARLTAAQREQRLATLRLVGATPGAVVGVTALETAVVAAIGAIGAWCAYLAILPVAARIPLAGAPFVVADLRLTAGTVGAVVLAVPVVAALSAVVALRRVAIGPLGVSRRVTGRRPRLVRLVSIPVAWALLVAAVASMRAGGELAGILVGLGAVIATLAVMGPWVTWMIGFAITRLARRPPAMIAGRRITDDPKGTYRTISGMVLAALIVGFVFAAIPSVERGNSLDSTAGERRELGFTIEGPSTAVELRAIEQAVVAIDPDATVVAADDGRDGVEADRSGVVVTSGTVRLSRGTDLEVVRTALQQVRPDAVIGSDGDRRGRDRVLIDDLGRASMILALAALAMAAAATAIGSVSSILDQRTTLARLRLAGTSLQVLQRARRWQAVVPLAAASAGAMATGTLAGLAMMRAFVPADDLYVAPSIMPLLLMGGAAMVAGALAVAVTRPVLVAASRTTPRE